MQANTSNKVKRIKIPLGHAWLMRFLPVELGPRKSFFARVANHWVNRRPIPCRRHTHPDFGGDPHAPCAMCDASEELNGHGSQRISSIGYGARSISQWVLFALVFEKDDGERSDVIKAPDMWDAHEFQITKNSFEDLLSIFRKGTRRCPLSILDLVQGQDIWVTQKKTGIRFAPEMPSAITNNQDKMQSIVDKIWSGIKFQEPKFLSSRELEDAADKLRDSAEDAGRGRGDDRDRGRRGEDEVEDYGRGRRDDRGRGRDDDRGSRGRDDDRSRGGYDSEDDAPRGRRGDDAPRSRRGEDDDAPRGRRGDDEDAPRGRREEEPRGRHDDEDDAPRGRRERDADSGRDDRGREDDDRGSRGRSDDRGRGEDDNEERSAPSASRRSMTPPSVSQTPRQAPPSASKTLPPPPARGGTNGAQEQSIDDDEAIPEERRDPAPPESMPEPEPEAQAPADAPPPVAAAGATPSAPRLSQRIRSGINSLDTRK